jgi:hypothetical protein
MSHRIVRLLYLPAVLTAALGAGCSSGGGAATPTAPSAPTTSGAGPQSPTNTSCTPGAPGNLAVSVNGSMRVFTWNAVSNVQDYFIQIGNAATASGNPDLIDTNTTQTTYTWTGASPGNYWARVYARNSCGSGPNSAQISFH